MKKLIIAALICASALCFAACVEKPAFQAVVVSEQAQAGDLFVVQSTDGKMTSGLLVLHLSEKKTTADPASLKPGDVIAVYGTGQIALSYPGQASCTNIKLVGTMDTASAAYEPFATEWKTFAERVSAF